MEYCYIMLNDLRDILCNFSEGTFRALNALCYNETFEFL